MDRESNQMEQHPVRCRNGCGFYGNPGTEGLCSVCYKEIIKKKQQPPANMPSTLVNTSQSSSSQPTEDDERSSISTASPTVLFSEKCSDDGAVASISSSDGMVLSDSEGDGQRNPKKKKNKCLTCKKKVGLTGFSCRCGGLFCALHRYSDKHDCNFDYKELGAEEIRKHNPVVVAAKVQKI